MVNFFTDYKTAERKAKPLRCNESRFVSLFVGSPVTPMNLELEPSRKEHLSLKVEPRMLQSLDRQAERLNTTRASLCRALLRHALQSLQGE